MTLTFKLDVNVDLLRKTGGPLHHNVDIIDKHVENSYTTWPFNRDPAGNIYKSYSLAN